MAPKRGTKRKAPATKRDVTETLSPPDRDTWQGWVEMESEPAFFNVMLEDMGVKGLRVQEVYGLEDHMLAILPQPVHALIFLFRYRTTDSLLRERGECPKNVWFANQTPDFACATFALLNIVNNIPNLHLGNNLHEFKEATKDSSPLQRGEAVENFRYVKRIHNSFAKESELLQAEVAMKEKFNKFKRREAQAKAKATREANSGAKALVVHDSHNSVTPTRSSGRSRMLTQKAVSSTDDADNDYDSDHIRMSRETASGGQKDEQAPGVRRSTRPPKPRKRDFTEYQRTGEEDEDGFHFIAYMPINGHVWRLDGLNKYPQDLGSIDTFVGWMRIAQPALVDRMAQYEGAEIEFNLMAVVHDPLESDREALLENIRTIRAYDKKLDELFEDWRALQGAETGCYTIVHRSLELNISDADIHSTDGVCKAQNIIDRAELLDLVSDRAEVIKQQAAYRAAVRDAMEASRSDRERADRRRRDYTGLVRGWLHALAEQEVLSELVDQEIRRHSPGQRQSVQILESIRQ